MIPDKKTTVTKTRLNVDFSIFIVLNTIQNKKKVQKCQQSLGYGYLISLATIAVYQVSATVIRQQVQ